MKFSTRSRYGLRFMTFLGARYGYGYIQLKEIAENEHISVKYLEQIVRLLKPTGLLQVSRGSRGGYALARDPEKISLYEIVHALEGSLSAIDCLDSIDCPMNVNCATVDLWQELSDLIGKYLRSKKLSQLVKLYKKKHNSVMYHI